MWQRACFCLLVFGLTSCTPKKTQLIPSKPGASDGALSGKTEVSNSFSHNIGFYKPNTSGIPMAVQKAAASVYEVVTPAGKLTTVRAIYGSTHTLAEIIQHIETMPNSSEVHQEDKDIYLYQLKKCREQSESLDCPLFEGDKISSGYLIGNGSHLRTAFHAVADVIPASAHSGTSSDIQAQVPIFLYDSNGKRVWSPANGQTTARFSRSELQVTEEPGYITAPDEDVVELDFGRVIGRPLKTATVRPEPGQQVFLIGFPEPTHDRATLQAPDSPGFQLRISEGHILTAAETAVKFGLKIEDLSAQSQAMLAHLIASDADGAPGLSGGATVTSAGTVLGTYTAGYPADGHVSQNHVSYSSDF